MARRTGFTLVETLMVIVVVSLTMLIALPKFSDAVAQGNLRTSRAKVMSFFSGARTTSMTSGRPTYLHVEGNQLYVTAIGRRKAGAGVQDTVTAVENVYSQYGVTMVSTADSVRIDPSGIGGTTATIRLLKGTRVDTIDISQYGRVQK